MEENQNYNLNIFSRSSATLEVVRQYRDLDMDYVEVKLLEGCVNLHDVFVDVQTGYRYVSETYLLVYTPAVDEDGEEYEKESMYETLTEEMCETFCFEMECENTDEYYPYPEPGAVLKAYRK